MLHFTFKRHPFNTIIHIGPFWLELFPANPGLHCWRSQHYYVGACAFGVGVNCGRSKECPQKSP